MVFVGERQGTDKGMPGKVGTDIPLWRFAHPAAGVSDLLSELRRKACESVGRGCIDAQSCRGRRHGKRPKLNPTMHNLRRKR